MPGPWFNKKMSSYQYRKSHCGDKTILRPSYLHNGISYTGKTTSLYGIGAQIWVNIGSGNDLLPDHQAINYQCWLIISAVCAIGLRAVSEGMQQPSIIKISLKITYLEFYWNLPGVNELTPLSMDWDGDGPPDNNFKSLSWRTTIEFWQYFYWLSFYGFHWWWVVFDGPLSIPMMT